MMQHPRAEVSESPQKCCCGLATQPTAAMIAVQHKKTVRFGVFPHYLCRRCNRRWVSRDLLNRLFQQREQDAASPEAPLKPTAAKAGMPPQKRGTAAPNQKKKPPAATPRQRQIIERLLLDVESSVDLPDPSSLSQERATRLINELMDGRYESRQSRDAMDRRVSGSFGTGKRR